MSGGAVQVADIVGCHATNYGTDPEYKEIRIPKGLVEFWILARGFPLYDEIVRSNWEAERKPKRKGDVEND